MVTCLIISVEDNLFNNCTKFTNRNIDWITNQG